MKKPTLFVIAQKAGSFLTMDIYKLPLGTLSDVSSTDNPSPNKNYAKTLLPASPVTIDCFQAL